MTEPLSPTRQLPRTDIEQRLQDTYVRGLAPPPSFAWLALEELGQQRRQIERLRAENARLEALIKRCVDSAPEPFGYMCCEKHKGMTWSMMVSCAPPSCALSVSPSALQGTNSNDISTLDGTQDALRMRCSTN